VEPVLIAVVSLGLGLVLTPLARAVAFRWAIVDRPGDLKTQRTPVAYLGGVAVFLAAIVGPVAAGRPAVLVPCALALGLGLADDLRPQPVRLRIGAEVVIAVVGASVIEGPALARVATAVLVIGLLNAVNLLDGQDGLAAGVGAVIALGFAVLGGDARPIGLAVAGALAGFLVFNRPPARIYLGDAGAYFLGTLFALLPALTADADTSWSVWWAVPLLVAVPVFDTAVAIARRARAHRPLLLGDRSHVYDQLVDRGLSVGRSSLVGIGVQVLLSTLGVLAAGAAAGVALGVSLVVIALAAALAVRGGFVNAGDSAAR
jgi:UDP-GlcNAc:undecaprenyl-phosphate/decaprenyl-phosphate GlcNAc-1-phosphate transferase